MKCKVCLMLMACCLWFAACGPKRNADSEETHLVLLYTTDVHGDILPYDFTNNKELTTSLAHACTYINSVREEQGGNVILIDGGDLTQGTPAMYYYNHIALRRQHLAARAVNYMGYDAVVLGNHDLEAGENSYLERLPRQMNMPILCANCIDARTGDPAFTPYTVIERQGFRIAVVGFITPAIHQWIPKSLWPHLTFLDIIESAEKWIPIIQEREQPDIIVGAFHAGSELYTVNEFNQPRTRIDGVTPTLKQVRGFDVALLGHDHQTMASHIVNNYGEEVAIIEPDAHSKQIARIDLYLKRSSEGKIQKRVSLSRVEIEGLPLSPDFVNHFKADKDSINAFLNRPLGSITETLNGAATLVGPSNLMDFIHEVQLSVTNADISFASAISTFHDIEAGNLTMRQIFSMYKFANHVHKIWMTGADVKRFLEYGYARQFNRMFHPDDHLLGFSFQADGSIPIGHFGPELRTPQYNFTSAAGIYYYVDVSKPAGHRVKILSMTDGQPFRPEKTYYVAINSYQASGGGGFLTNGLGWTPEDIEFHTVNESSKDMCFYIAEYIKQRGAVTPSQQRHWYIEPTSWWPDASLRDTEFLLPYLMGHNRS